MSGIHGPRLFAILVTFLRPIELSTMLSVLSRQSRRPDFLVVVDNSPAPGNGDILRRNYPSGEVKYVPAPENLGPAGAIAMGMDLILKFTYADDWILLLDDDNPPPSATVIEELYLFGQQMRLVDTRTAAVGLVGTVFDWKRGEVRRPPGSLNGAVPVDEIGGSKLPMYLSGAVRDVGTYQGPLFFGWEELDYGLRLRRAGYSLYAHAALWRSLRDEFNRLRSKTNGAAVFKSDWRWYYGVRNLIYICRLHHRRLSAVRVTLRRGLARPVRHFLKSRMSVRALALSWRAIWDGWSGRMGRTVEPRVGS